MLRFWNLFLARFRLSDRAICEMSKGRSVSTDFHDYMDSVNPLPWHMYDHRCRRCGKTFTI